jgi:hypothetical protein
MSVVTAPVRTFVVGANDAHHLVMSSAREARAPATWPETKLIFVTAPTVCTVANVGSMFSITEKVAPEFRVSRLGFLQHGA